MTARWPLATWVAGGILFAVLATANGAGYRYGVSDQAFYIPVVTHAVNPDLFPRDATLIDAQGRLMLGDEIMAGLVRITGLPLDVIFFTGYLLSLAIIWAGVILIGNHVFANPWATVALGAVFTLRHRIPRTSANSFEPYFHPRMLAFGIGLIAVAALLRRRYWIAVLLVGASALIHVTTAIWFSILIGVALVTLDPTWRRLGVVAGVIAITAGGWALIAGPLQSSMTRMDAVWLQAVASKDSLFPSDWPVWAWAANLGLLAVLWWAHARRTRLGLARAEDTALVWGCASLVALFLVTLPLVVARFAFPVQLQISRVFWLVDALATVYVLSLLVDRRIAKAVAIALAVISIARGSYVMLVERPERVLFDVHLSDSPWEDAMHWISHQPVTTHVLADPGHSWKYGTSVRVSASRDVFLEDVKDSAIAIYSRDVAQRVVERTGVIGDFGAMTAERARELATRYGLDLLVTEADVALPVSYRNQQFKIYDLHSTP